MGDRRGWLRQRYRLALAYSLVGACGVLVFTDSASPTLSALGGPAVTMVWGAVCAVSSIIALTGLITNRVGAELIGASLGAAASLTLATALMLQALSTHSTRTLTAAFLAGALTCMIAQRWVDVRGDGRQ